MIVRVVAIACLSALLVGCGTSYKDGVNKGLDMPVAPKSEPTEKK